MLNVTVTGDREVVQRLQSMPPTVHALLVAKTRMLAINLQGHVKVDKLSGRVLNRISGRLSSSIKFAVDDAGSSVYGRVFSSGDVKYAAIHEFGGVIKHPGGTAYIPDGVKKGSIVGASFISNAAAAAIGGDLPRTKPHQIVMPERSYLRSSLKDMAAEISAGLKAAVVQGAKQAMGRAA